MIWVLIILLVSFTLILIGVSIGFELASHDNYRLKIQLTKFERELNTLKRQQKINSIPLEQYEKMLNSKPYNAHYEDSKFVSLDSEEGKETFELINRALNKEVTK